MVYSWRSVKLHKLINGRDSEHLKVTFELSGVPSYYVNYIYIVFDKHTSNKRKKNHSGKEKMKDFLGSYN